ncbi:hypothetical protein HDU76_002032, partial [Blyttiomyces sp. JEL0837]
MTEIQTVAAIEAAHDAQPAWAKMLARDRSNLMSKLYDEMIKNRDDLAMIMTAESGKPLAESVGEVSYAASFIRWFAEEAPRIYGDMIPQNAHGRRILVMKQPIGVCAIISPWNFPAAMITRKIGPALAAGNTCVIKPASETPLSALALAELARRAGIPDGVVNVVTSSRENTPRVGLEMTNNDKVRKVSFTGSTGVGRLLMSQAASTVKKVSLELGGNAPFVVFDDADLDAAVEGCIASKFRNSGQTAGSGSQPGVNIGPLISPAAVAKVTTHVDYAWSRGSQIACQLPLSTSKGNFYPPTVLSGMTDEMRMAHEETFGPVAGVFKFDSEEE